MFDSPMSALSRGLGRLTLDIERFGELHLGLSLSWWWYAIALCTIIGFLALKRW